MADVTKVPDNSGLFHLMEAATALSQLVDSGKDSTAAAASSPNSAILQQNVEMPPQDNVQIAPNGSVPLDKASTPAAKEKKASPTHQPREIFPQRLMRILSDTNISDVITWLPHGRSFVVLQPDELAEKVLPIYFPESSSSGNKTGNSAACKYPSFTRKLNRWGFRQVTRGPDAGAFHHHLFIRDEPSVCLQMVCQRSRRRKDDGKYPGHSILPRHDYPHTAQHAQTESGQESDTHRTGSPTDMNNQTAIVSNSSSPTPTKASVTKNPNIGGYPPHPPGSYRPPSYTANAPFVHPHTMPSIPPMGPPFPMNGPYGRMMPYMPYGQPPFGMNAPGPYKLAQASSTNASSPNKPATGKAEEVPESTTTSISSNEVDTNNKSTEQGESEHAKKNEEERLATAKSMLFNAYMKALA